MRNRKQLIVKLSSLLIVLTLVTFMGCPKKQTVVPVQEEIVVVAPPDTMPKETTIIQRPPLILNRVFFDFDKSDIRTDAADVLKANAEVLKLYPEINVVIEGNTCEIGTAEYNMALGERRAYSARDYLLMLGLTPDRLSTVSYGEERPLDATDLPKNRRCEFSPK